MQSLETRANVSQKTKHIVTSALLAAIICLVTGYIFHIPYPNGGYAHIGDSIIYLSACILPLPYAMVCSALGAGLADFTTGAFIWILPTIIIKPILVLFFDRKSDKIITKRNVAAAFFAGLTGYVLYNIAEGFMFGNFLAAFMISWMTFVQPVGSFIVFIVLGIFLDKINFKSIYTNK